MKERRQRTSLIDTHAVNGNGLLALVDELCLDRVVRQESAHHKSICNSQGPANPEKALPDLKVVRFDESDTEVNDR
jgi:hypothetical protein